MKDELALKTGLTRGQIEDYMAQAKAKGSAPAAPSAASAGGEIHVNPQTGQKIRWNGSAWEAVQ